MSSALASGAMPTWTPCFPRTCRSSSQTSSWHSSQLIAPGRRFQLSFSSPKGCILRIRPYFYGCSSGRRLWTWPWIHKTCKCCVHWVRLGFSHLQNPCACKHPFADNGRHRQGPGQFSGCKAARRVVGRVGKAAGGFRFNGFGPALFQGVRAFHGSASSRTRSSCSSCVSLVSAALIQEPWSS